MEHKDSHKHKTEEGSKNKYKNVNQTAPLADSLKLPKSPFEFVIYSQSQPIETVLRSWQSNANVVHNNNEHSPFKELPDM